MTPDGNTECFIRKLHIRFIQRAVMAATYSSTLYKYAPSLSPIASCIDQSLAYDRSITVLETLSGKERVFNEYSILTGRCYQEKRHSERSGG